MKTLFESLIIIINLKNHTRFSCPGADPHMPDAGAGVLPALPDPDHGAYYYYYYYLYLNQNLQKNMQ